MSGPAAISPDQFTTFGDLLKYLRRRAALSQRELAIAAGYSESQISRLEQNQRAPDEAAVAARFVPALHLDRDPTWAARLVALAHAAPHAAGKPAADPSQPYLGDLPLQLTSFIGRTEEVAALGRLLSPDPTTPIPTRLLTLTGAGGTGKTRLALAAAAALAPQFRNGVTFVDLSPIREAALVMPTIGQVLAIPAQPGRPPLDRVADHLRDQQRLLVLDNFEQVVAAAPAVVELLARAPQVTALVTSRAPLHVRGEREYPVSPLATPDVWRLPPLAEMATYPAIQLFTERAQAGRPDFALTPTNAPFVAALCHRLDGLPLAVELAAARVKAFPPQTLLAQLDRGPRLLTGGPRDAPARQQALQATLDWSHGLLSEAEQRLLRRLGVFVGGWMLAAAEAVTAGDDLAVDDIPDLLSELVDQSLVVAEVREGEGYYRLLETIREYAVGKLEASGEAEAVRRRHAEYYLGFIEAGRGSAAGYVEPSPAWFAQMRVEGENVRAATTWVQSARDARDLEVRFAASLHWLDPRYLEGDPRVWLERALAHAEASGTPAQRAEILTLLGLRLAGWGELATSQARLAESLRLSREMGDVRRCAWLLNRLGWLARERGDGATARLWLEESIALYRQLGDQGGIAEGLNTLGEVAVMEEDAATATTLLTEALLIQRARAARAGTAWSLNHLGHVAQLEGDYERATRLHEASLPLFQASDNAAGGSAEAFQALGECALGLGDAKLARARFAEALTYRQRYMERLCDLWCVAGLAGVAALAGQPRRAARLWGAAEARRQAIGARPAPAARATRERLMAMAREQLGDAAFDAAWADGATMTLEQALAEAQKVES